MKRNFHLARKSNGRDHGSFRGAAITPPMKLTPLGQFNKREFSWHSRETLRRLQFNENERF